MWQFAVGLFLVDLSPGSLRLTASYGFATGGTILLLGAVVGNWIDNNPRLKGTISENQYVFIQIISHHHKLYVYLIADINHAFRDI